MVKSVSSGKIVRETGTKPSPTGLPAAYGETKLVILPRDPLWIFAYWEIDDLTRKELKKKFGANYSASRYDLRVYDVTDIDFDGSNAHAYFDVQINPDANNWYINCQKTNRAWCVDLGLILPDGKFYPIIRSNVVKMPRVGISPIIDEKWGILQKEFEQLMQLSGLERIGKSSFDVVKLMKERWEEIVAVSLPSSLAISSFRLQPKKGAAKKDFWLKADTELIVYGSTERDAVLTVQGKKVNLRDDGSFSLRFSLPDGVIDIPIEARSADKKMGKKIIFKVSRKSVKG